MSQLSTHFAQKEFEKGDSIPDECVPIFKEMCDQILEKVRDHVGAPIRITSGYRSPARNAAVGGSATSQHVATSDHCAVDFQCPDLVRVFNWLRLESGLRFDQLILEYGRLRETDSDDCIHVSYSRAPRRMAMVGATHNREPYLRMDVA